MYEKTGLKTKHPEVAKSLFAKVKHWQSMLPEKPTGDVFSKLRRGGLGLRLHQPGRRRGGSSSWVSNNPSARSESRLFMVSEIE